MDAIDALYDEPGIRMILTRHEQATTCMADGYVRDPEVLAPQSAFEQLRAVAER